MHTRDNHAESNDVLLDKVTEMCHKNRIEKTDILSQRMSYFTCQTMTSLY